MRKNFSYVKFNDDKADTLVMAFNKLVDMVNENKGNTEEYKTANKLFSQNIVEYCVNGTGLNYSNLEMVKNPMVYDNIIFKSRFATILAQAITPAVPTVISGNYDQLFEVFQVGFGNSAKYQVESNELYIVNDIAEGIKRGAQMTTYNQEYSVSASRRQISVFVDWYEVAAGVQDWGKFGRKIGLSFGAAVQSMVVKSMSKVITDAASHGISGYMANGFNDDNWLKLARNVKLANGNSQVYALGTDIAIGKIMPDAAAFRFGPDSDIVTKGALPAYKNVPLIPLDNALVPNTVNKTPKAILGDDFIYMIAMGSYKPVKVVVEGNNVAVSENPFEKKDHTYSMTVDMRIGADSVVGSKFGYLKLV